MIDAASWQLRPAPISLARTSRNPVQHLVAQIRIRHLGEHVLARGGPLAPLDEGGPAALHAPQQQLVRLPPQRPGRVLRLLLGLPHNARISDTCAVGISYRLDSRSLVTDELQKEAEICSFHADASIHHPSSHPSAI